MVFPIVHRHFAPTLTLTVGLFFVSNTTAVEIVVDPGAVGSTSGSIAMPFSTLNGQSLDGSNFVLDFVFPDMKYIEAIMDGDPAFVEASAQLTTDGSASFGIGSIGGGFFSDENGDPVLTAGALAYGTSGSPGLFVIEFNVQLTADQNFHDVHFGTPAWTWPTASNTQITGGQLVLTGSSSTLTVGEWSVPEPAILALFGIGIAGIGYQRSKRGGRIKKIHG